MKIAVTGGGGFVGINLVRQLCERGHEVTALDRNFAPHVRELLKDFKCSACETIDVLDMPALVATLTQRRSDAIFHGATLTADLARERVAFADILATNVIGTVRVLEASRAVGMRRVIIASSSAVYGDAVFSQSPKETDAAEPVTLYGISKLAAERAALRFGGIYEMDVAAVRISAVFGPWEHRSGARDVMSPLFQIAEKAVAGLAVTLPDGGERDWIEARRVAAVLTEMLERDRLNHRLYNLGAAATWSPRIFCKELERALPNFHHLQTAPNSAPDIEYRDDLTRRRFPLDTTRVRAEFGPDILGVPKLEAAQFASWVSSNKAWFQ